MAKNNEELLLKNIYSAFKEYDMNLKNKSLLILFQINNNKFDHIVINFRASNFMHLTGCTYLKGSATQFYKALKKNIVSTNDISFQNHSTSELKSKIINNISNLHRTTKMIGDFNGTKRIFQNDQTGKVAGNVYSSLALLEVDNMYVPVSALNEDIRNLVIKTHKVVAIFRKNDIHKSFDELCYLEKNMDIASANLSKPVKQMLIDYF